MGVNDAREQLEVAKVEVVRLETELEQIRRLHEVATSRCVELAAELIQLKGGLAARDAAKWDEGFEGGRGFDVRNPYRDGREDER